MTYTILVDINDKVPEVEVWDEDEHDIADLSEDEPPNLADNVQVDPVPRSHMLVVWLLRFL